MDKKNSFLKPAIKITKPANLLDRSRIAESANIRLVTTKIPLSPMLKANYIKSTRASQILYLKNNKSLDPSIQVELNINRYELARLPHMKKSMKKRNFDYNKATESLTPIKEKISKTSKIGVLSKMSNHIANVDKQNQLKNKKLELIPSKIMIDLTEQNNFDEFYLEKYVNMINIDQEIFYLGSSFLSIFLESISNSLFNKQNQSIDKKMENSSLTKKMENTSLTNTKNLSNNSLNVRFSNHYSNKNLTNLSKLSIDSLTTSNTNRSNNNTLTKNKLLSLNSESKLSMNSRSDYEEKASVKSSMFGIHFPMFTLEKFRENVLTLKYLNSKYRFMRIIMKNSIKVEIDIGFIEFEINEKKYLEIHKLYIIKVYRKMEIYESILDSLFNNLFVSEYAKNAQKMFIKVLDRFESYKALLGRLGFLLNEKVKIKEEYIAYLLLKKKK